MQKWILIKQEFTFKNEFFFSENLSELSTMCKESGLWQQVVFSCVFDPMAVNLKQGTKLFGGSNKMFHFFLIIKRVLTVFFTFIYKLLRFLKGFKTLFVYIYSLSISKPVLRLFSFNVTENDYDFLEASFKLIFFII